MLQQVATTVSREEFELNDFNISLVLPAALHIRQWGIWHHLVQSRCPNMVQLLAVVSQPCVLQRYRRAHLHRCGGSERSSEVAASRAPAEGAQGNLRGTCFAPRCGAVKSILRFTCNSYLSPGHDIASWVMSCHGMQSLPAL